MRSTRLANRVVCTAGVLLLGLSAGTAQAEFVVSVYLGDAITGDTDVDLLEPGVTNLTFENVPFNAESFESPIYYGYRMAYWPDSLPRFGVAIDFTHAKAIADRSAVVTVTGTRAGVPVSGTEPVSGTFSDLEFSHGHNILTANALYRWFPAGQRDKTLLGRIQPYIGAGAGVAIPHVEVTTATSTVDEYQLGGPAVQALGGVNFDLFRYLSTFAEYKFSFAAIEADLGAGAELETNLFTHHFVIGLSARF